MHSPMAISSIAVSRSEHDSTSSQSLQFSPKHFRYRPQQNNHNDNLNNPPLLHPAASLTSNPLPVLVHIKRERILFGAIAFGACITALMYALSDGVVVATFQKSPSDHAVKRIEDYNFYLGAITSLFVKPLLGFVSLVVPVALLCFATSAYMQKQRTWKAQIAIFTVVNVILWLLSNGFHAANVHLTSARIEPVLSNADLSRSSSASLSAGLLSSSSSKQTDESQKSVVDSILRTAVQSPQQPQKSVRCDRKSPRRLPALTEFGFPSRDWFADLLPTAPAPEGSLKIKVADLPEVSTPASFPVELASARSLFTYSLYLMNDFFRDPSEPTTAASSGSSASGSFELDLPSGFDQAGRDDAKTVSSFYEAMQDKLTTIFNASSSSSSYKHFANFNIDSAEVEFATYKLSSQLTFEAITFDIPLTDSELRRQVFLTESSDTTENVVYGNQDGVFEINPKEECSWNGCVISPKGDEMSAAAVDYGSQVRALPICLDDNSTDDLTDTLNGTRSTCRTTTSDSSMLVFSFAKRIAGDEIKCELNDTAGLVTLTNPTKFYTVTVGRLSWETSNIADAFGASCEAEDGCEGLSFPLGGGKKVLVVGQQHLPLNQLQKFSSSSPSTSGSMLVGSNVQEIDDGGALKHDFIFPHNFKRVKSWDGIEGRYCEVERGNFLDLVVRDHLYSEDSLQPAYMSALFWLFQNAVVKETRALLSVEEATATLDFSANVEWVDAQVSIPTFSAILTCSGCAILVLLSVVIQLGGKRKESHIETFFFAHHLARLVLNDDEFPRHLVKCNLLSVENDSLGSSEHLDEFEIMGLALSHCKDPDTVLHVPKQPPTASFLSV